IAQELLRAGARPDRLTHFETPLYKAARCGDAEMVKALLEGGADPNAAISIWPSIKGTYRDTALHVAVKEGFKNIVELLIAAGVDVNKPDHKSHTALDVAEGMGFVEIGDALTRAGGLKQKSWVPSSGSGEWQI